MKLGDWLKNEGLTHDDFVVFLKQNGLEISKPAIAKWCYGQRIPRKKEMQKISEVTDLKVTANDFYEIKT